MRYFIGSCLLVPIIVKCIIARKRSLARQHRGDKPRLVYGPAGIISIKYMSQAMQRIGYDAKTMVYAIPRINTRGDFDYYLRDLFKDPKGRLGTLIAKALSPYRAFMWLLPRFDIFNFFFTGGFLAHTPLNFLEVQLLHLAGKKVVVMPFGADVAVTNHIHSLLWRQGVLYHNPSLGRVQDQIMRRIFYFSRYADYIVGCLFHAETLCRWDTLTIHYYPIDTDAWKPGNSYSKGNGTEHPVSIVHTPNHRMIKGTDFLITAVNELREEGYQIDLRLLEGIPNEKVREVLEESDILAEQFIHGYALSAMEGMSLGKPVMSNLSDDEYYTIARLYLGLDECPIVNTPIDKIKHNLRMLVESPDLRRKLGEDGRRYVIKYHSYEAMGRMWDAIYRKIWYGEKLDLAVWHPDRFPDRHVGDDEAKSGT